jgi:hypothetical protein
MKKCDTLAELPSRCYAQAVARVLHNELGSNNVTLVCLALRRFWELPVKHPHRWTGATWVGFTGFWRGIGLACAALLLVATPGRAQTTRPEAVTRAILSVERGCPITPPLNAQQRAARPVRMLPILGTFAAGIAGNLVTSGLNAIGSALESASQEKAFVAEGVSSFTTYRVDNGGKPTDKWQAIPDLEVEVLPDGAIGPVPDQSKAETAERCVVLIMQASRKGSRTPPMIDAKAIQDAFSASGIPAARAANAEKRLKALGVTTLPILYVEAELIGASDGLVIQPVLIRYAAPLPGAPKGTTATELDVSFAVPAAPNTTDIGTVFALARIPLPEMAPVTNNGAGSGATVLNRYALQAYASVVVPMRSTSGLTDTVQSARNGIVTSIDTKKAQVAQLREALRLAQRKLDQNKDASKTQDLTNARDDGQLALTDAIADQAKLTQAARADVLLAGSTNVKARFLVIRDANEFGLALAKALKAQADATGKTVTDKLAPEPAWTSKDTAYVEAESAVRAAQRAVDDAITAGETTKVPGLQDAVIAAKAKANEAAVASGRQPPYVILP